MMQHTVHIISKQTGFREMSDTQKELIVQIMT